MDLKGKRVLVTGGASGLGLALVEQFRQSGALVCVADIDQENGRKVASQLSAENDSFFIPLDITSPEQWQQAGDTLQSRWDGLDILVNNAGVAGTVGAIDQVDENDWRWVIDINLHGTVNGCRAMMPMLKKSEMGVIINIASAAGLMNAPMMASYNVSKAAVISLSETLHTELQRFGIQTIVACPAFFTTNLTNNMRSQIPGMHERVQKMMARSGVTAKDVAQKIVEAVGKRRFLVITHKLESRLWLVKRFFPWLFFKLLANQARKIVGKKASQPDTL